MFQSHRLYFSRDKKANGNPPTLEELATKPVELTTTIDPKESHYRNRKLNWCFVSQQPNDQKPKTDDEREERRGPDVEKRLLDPEEPEKDDPPVNLQYCSDYNKILQGISTKDYERNVATLDIAKLATFKNATQCRTRMIYFLLTITTILIGIFTEFDQIGLYYYLFIRKTMWHDNTLIMFLSLYGAVTFHAVLSVQIFLVGGCCKCFSMQKDWTFKPLQRTFSFFTCHLGVAGDKYMEAPEKRGEQPESDQQKRERLNAQINIKWWMLVPGFRPLIILMSQGNPDQALQYKSIHDLQIEKNQTYRAFAVMGQLNLVTSTIPCAIIGTMMIDWSNPTADIAQLVFMGMAFCSATLSIITMCFGVIDGLVNTIDTMDRSLNDYRAQQKSMRETITYAKMHFDNITTLSDDVRLVLARFRQLPYFSLKQKCTPIATSECVSALAACRASINSFVCEDANQLELVQKIRGQIKLWLQGGDESGKSYMDGLILTPEVYLLFEMLKGDLMKWTMLYAMHLERALENVDNMSLNDSEFDRVRDMLEGKEHEWKEVATKSIRAHVSYNLDKAYSNIIPEGENSFSRGLPGVTDGVCKCGKKLSYFKADHDRYLCDQCVERQPKFADMYGCRVCKVDCCSQCYDRLGFQKEEEIGGNLNLDIKIDDDESDEKEEEIGGDFVPCKRSALQSEKDASNNKRSASYGRGPTRHAIPSSPRSII